MAGLDDRQSSETDDVELVYTYNDRGWLETTTLPDPDGAGALARPVSQYQYTATGQVFEEIRRTTNPTDGSAVTRYGYDSRIPLSEIAFPTMDEDGRRLRVFQHVYDDAIPLPTITDPPSETTTYDYGVPSPLDTAKVTAYEHDELQPLETLTQRMDEWIRGLSG